MQPYLIFCMKNGCKLSIDTLQGQEFSAFVPEVQEKGMHSIKLSGESLANGFYIYQLRTGKKEFVGKIIKQYKV